MQPWALVTPASRGIGAALTRRILQTTNVPVVATSRTNQDETKEKLLAGLKGVEESRLTVLKLDVLGIYRLSNPRLYTTIVLTLPDEPSIEAASSHCSSAFPKDSHHLHLAFTVPGLLFPEKSPSQISAQDALLTFQTNTIGPLLLMKHFSAFLPTKRTQLPTNGSTDAQDLWRGLSPSTATYAIMSARVGSISDNSLGGWYSYRASKAAVNQVVKTFDNHLRTSAGDAAMAVALHPGTVKTDLSKAFWAGVKEGKLFEADWVAERLVGLCAGGIGVEGRGRCWDFDGKEVPP